GSEGSQRLDELHRLGHQFLEEEERLDAERSAHLEHVTRQQNLALLGGVALALVSTGLLLYGFSRGIGRRLAVLNDNVRRLAEGKEMAPPLSGRDEISRLDRAFHDMAEALAQKDRENEMFVYSVSHDLRAPLGNLE